MAKKLFFNAAAGTLLFLVLFFLSAIFFSQVLLKSEVVSVPNVTGRTVPEARAELKKKDLSLAQKGSEASDRVERGLIVRQDPAADSKVRTTTPVQVVISSGSGTVTVPELMSKTLDEALTLLQAAGLTKGRLSQVHTPSRPAGRILDQRPTPGAVVERGFPVGLLLSQGELDNIFMMPDLLVGLKADHVIGRFDAWGFKIADVRYVYYPGQPAGIIVGQDPKPGYPVRRRGRISLEVSR